MDVYGVQTNNSHQILGSSILGDEGLFGPSPLPKPQGPGFSPKTQMIRIILGIIWEKLDSDSECINSNELGHPLKTQIVRIRWEKLDSDSWLHRKSKPTTPNTFWDHHFWGMYNWLGLRPYPNHKDLSFPPRRIFSDLDEKAWRWFWMHRKSRPKTPITFWADNILGWKNG